MRHSGSFATGSLPRVTRCDMYKASIERPAGARRFLSWTAWPLLLAPATILLHELGHLLAAIALGFPEPALHFSSISHGDVSNRPAWQLGVVGLAGPIVTGILVLVGIASATQRPQQRFGYGLAVAAVSRFSVGVPYSIVNLVAWVSGRTLNPPAFDEYKAGEALQWSGNLTLGVTAAIVFAVLVWLLLRLLAGERAVAWLGFLLGTTVGWALWFGLAPLLLP